MTVYIPVISPAVFHLCPLSITNNTVFFDRNGDNTKAVDSSSSSDNKVMQISVLCPFQKWYNAQSVHSYFLGEEHSISNVSVPVTAVLK